MNSTSQKGLKPLLLKVIAIAMSLCYVLGPSHRELNKVLHVFVHQLEMPETVLSHANDYSSNHVDHGDFNRDNNSHKHGILDALTKIIEASTNDHDSNHSKTITLKIDKHLKNRHLKWVQYVVTYQKVQHKFIFAPQNIHSVFLDVQLQPPQLG